MRRARSFVAAVPNGHHWITLVLTGTTSNRSAIGARVEVTADGVRTVQEVSGGAGRGSFNSLPVEFGLGTAASVEAVFIRWPSGVRQRVTGVAVDTRVTITEPAPGDLDGNGVVDAADLIALLAAWGKCPGRPDDCLADVDSSGRVDVADLVRLLGNWG